MSEETEAARLDLEFWSTKELTDRLVKGDRAMQEVAALRRLPRCARWDLKAVTSFEEAQELADGGWDLVAVTETFEMRENSRKGYQETSTNTTFYLKRAREEGEKP